MGPIEAAALTEIASRELCCESCFKHTWLRQQARQNGKGSWVCFYCGDAGALVPVSVFYAGFGNLLKDYIPAEYANGCKDNYLKSVPVIEAVERDWKLFSPRIQARKLNYFLPAVFKDQKLPFPCGFDTAVVPFHRNAFSTAYDKWLDFWFLDPSTFSAWPERYTAGDIDTLGTFVHQAASHLEHFVRKTASGRMLWRARAGHLGKVPRVKRKRSSNTPFRGKPGVLKFSG